MDATALRIANILVGNDEGMAAIECTLHGLRMQFQDERVVAITGAGAAARLDDEAIPYWKPFIVRAGDTLSLEATDFGCRTYVAVAGGLDVPTVLGSRSTYMRACIGGHEGRALRDRDALPLGEPRDFSARILRHISSAGTRTARWRAGSSARPRYSRSPGVRFVPGGMISALHPGARATFRDEWFTVSVRSDRMGIRLEGHEMRLQEHAEILSAPVTTGTIQLPPDGIPIVLMADGQTTGGYPRLGEVVSADLPLLAQLRPGDRVRFSEVSVDEAVRAWHERERELVELRGGLEARLRYQP